MNKNKIINGIYLAKIIENNIKNKIKEYKKNNYRMPKLIIIQIGNLKESNIYIKNKEKICKKVGVEIEIYKLNEKIKENELIKIINKFNNDILVDGIIIQLPIPIHINKNIIIEKINYLKDVDGFNINNLGKIINNNYYNKLKILPATPKGIISLLKYYKINIEGENIVIIGRSNIVGKPLANIFINLRSNSNNL